MKRLLLMTLITLQLVNASSNILTEEEYNLYLNNKSLRERRIKELKSEIRQLKRELNNLSYGNITDLEKDKRAEMLTEIRREKKETRKELRNESKIRLKEIDKRMEYAETNKEYEELKRQRKELRKQYITERRKYRDDSYVEEKIEESVEEFRTILQNLEKNSLTFVTNGTRISKQGTEEEYFFGTDKRPDSFTYTEEFGSIFNSKESYFLSWEGKNNDPARRAAADKFVRQIKTYAFRKSMRTGLKPKEVPINLIGHSHGGNIMILVCNALMREDYNVQFLFTLNTPRREYIPVYPVEHVQLYSYDDGVQKIGGWDFDFLWQDMDYHGPAARKFENAININLNYFLDYETYSFFSKEFLGLYKTGRDYYHQITRYLGIIEKIILDESKMRTLKSAVN